jgi:hypothetical protein
MIDITLHFLAMIQIVHMEIIATMDVLAGQVMGSAAEDLPRHVNKAKGMEFVIAYMNCSNNGYCSHDLNRTSFVEVNVYPKTISLLGERPITKRLPFLQNMFLEDVQ